MAGILIDNINVVFGNNQKEAITLADSGASVHAIQYATNCILGVHNCSLDVSDGNILAITGKTGSGKSTLLRTVAGLIKPCRGQIIVNNNQTHLNVATALNEDLLFLQSHLISAVFQKFELQQNITVKDKISEGLDKSRLNKQQLRAAIEERLQFLGLKKWENQKLKKLSPEIQQYIGLASIFFKNTPIMLMDEPFSTLPQPLCEHLQSEFIKLQNHFQKTIIFVTADIREAMKIGNQIAIMDEGRMMQCGTLKDIILAPRNERVVSFIRPIKPLSLLTAKHIMRPLTRDNSNIPVSAMVKPETQLYDLISAIDKKTGAIGVIENSKIIGVIVIDDIINHVSAYKNK